MANFTYSDAGFALTKSFEGLYLSAYQDQGGVWTVGYGHTGAGVHAGLTITQEQADLFLESDVARGVSCVNRVVVADIRQGQFDALVDFTFNLGCATLSQSTLLRAVNAGFYGCCDAVSGLGPCVREGGSGAFAAAAGGGGDVSGFGLRRR